MHHIPIAPPTPAPRFVLNHFRQRNPQPSSPTRPLHLSEQAPPSSSKIQRLRAALGIFLLALATQPAAGAPAAPEPEEQQLPRRMHSKMTDVPTIRVGLKDADIMGGDNRALQAAVDYVAGLGGGVVEIGPGEYVMRDSLHLHSFITLRGTPGQTILRKAAAFSSPLALDGDFGEEQVTLSNPDGFEVGSGIAVWDRNAAGFHLTVARIIGKRENTFAIDNPLMSDCMVANGGTAATLYPVVSGRDIEGARIEHLVIDGNRDHNPPLDGCRGGGIYLYRAFNTVIESCHVRDFNGDGISFQQSNDVLVQNCVSERNAALGLHPGSGSQRPIVRGCTALNNGTDGLFLCWRVRHGLFEDNQLLSNGRFGISIGHKDSDNLLRRNSVRENHEDGVFFRNESFGMAGHRNLLEDNLIENNGQEHDTAGIRIRGETHDVILRRNSVRDTRPPGQQRQTVGVYLDQQVGPVLLENNQLEASVPVDDRRDQKP